MGILYPTKREMIQHYSIFCIFDGDGDPIHLELGQIEYLYPMTDNGGVFCTLIGLKSGSKLWDYSDGAELLEAWTTYKAIQAAKSMINLPDTHNPTVAVNSAIRIDNSLAFFVNQQAGKE